MPFSPRLRARLGAPHTQTPSTLSPILLPCAETNTTVGTDEFGNRYFENYNAAQEQPGRQRWVDYAQHDYNASQVPPGWRAWLSHIRELPPTKDAVVQASKQSWQVPYKENL